MIINWGYIILILQNNFKSYWERVQVNVFWMVEEETVH